MKMCRCGFVGSAIFAFLGVLNFFRCIRANRADILDLMFFFTAAMWILGRIIAFLYYQFTGEDLDVNNKGFSIVFPISVLGNFHEKECPYNDPITTRSTNVVGDIQSNACLHNLSHDYRECQQCPNSATIQGTLYGQPGYSTPTEFLCLDHYYLNRREDYLYSLEPCAHNQCPSGVRYICKKCEMVYVVDGTPSIMCNDCLDCDGNTSGSGSEDSVTVSFY